jgi:hypothetical protein
VTTSMFVEACGLETIEDGVERVSSVIAEDSVDLVDAMDFTSSNCLLSVSVYCSRILSRVLRLVACTACVDIKLEMRAMDSSIRSSVACIREAVEIAMSSTRAHIESSLSPCER